MKAKKTIALASIVVVFFVGLLITKSFYPGISWRISVLKLKWDGAIPTQSWGQVFSEYLGTNKKFGQSLVNGFVTLNRFDPNGKLALWDTPSGAFWGRYQDEFQLEVMIREEIQRKIYDTFAKVKPGDVVIDVGSHLGVFTRFSLDRGASLVVAFEPDPVTIICFKRSFKKEIKENRVILIEAAAWHTAGSLKFEDVEIWSGGSKVSETGELVVPAVKIDDTIKSLGLPQVDFIKMDIEGSERHAIAGALKTITRFSPRMAICTYHEPDDPEVVLELVTGARPDYQVLQAKLLTYFRSPPD